MIEITDELRNKLSNTLRSFTNLHGDDLLNVTNTIIEVGPEKRMELSIQLIGGPASTRCEPIYLQMASIGM